MVHNRIFPSRSKAIQEAAEERIIRIDKSHLARECAKLDPIFEQHLAEAGILHDMEKWPELFLLFILSSVCGYSALDYRILGNV